MQTNLSPAIDLTQLARQAMLERHLLPDYPPSVLKEVGQINGAASPTNEIDLRSLLWCSIDNDDSRDLDQLTYAEALPNEEYKIYIAVADVDSIVKKDSAIDRYAQANTTSIYTPTKIFSMLPEKLSTDVTSLNENEDRLAITSEVIIAADGSIKSFKIYPSIVHNHAKLAYNSLAAWLDDRGPLPEKISQVPGLEEQLQLQDKIAHLLKNYRHNQGALTLETIESSPILKDNQIVDIKVATRNRARDLIEDFMIAANTATARFLKQNQLPSLRRVVRIPKRWDRIREIAEKFGETLPEDPDAKALDLFLIKRRLLDPIHFPDLSLTVIKLLGNGEYVVEYPGQDPIGHFSLAVKDYTHSTAPNRRYPDLITQRMIKSVFQNQPPPYTTKELESLARQCTEKEDEAEKVERKMKKSASISLLSSKIGETFDALVTGAGDKGTWVRVISPPVEGKLIKGDENVDVGDSIRVKLIQVNIEKGFIDFMRV
jgi:VacB/RNase II family 3'-5' exoribonuclease